MRRRKFIKNVLFTTGAGVLGTQFGCTPENIQNETKNPGLSNSGSITEPAQDITIIAETDVLVIG